MSTVTVCGHVALDFIFEVPRHPEPDHSIYIQHMERHYGGGAANITVGISRLGGSSELVAAVPTDFAHTDYGRYLQEQGVRLRVTSFKGELPRAYIFNDPQHRQITYFSWGVSEHLPQMVPEAETVHLAPVHPDFACAMADRASFLAFEPGQDLPRYSAPQLVQVLDRTDLLFVNQYEIQTIEKMTGLDLDSLARRMDVVLTRGPEGCQVHRRGECTVIPAVPATVADPTGAGDAHRATCWAGLMRGLELEEACRLANLAASLVVQQRGAQSGLPDWDTLLRCAERSSRTEKI
ncbi:MAG: carbohydrate kinase family protein [Candidatus Thermoplasmatota archaeon]|nr:carbohydrate kinase family protein [Candidatus Thermoplasmatota archaeon]